MFQDLIRRFVKCSDGYTYGFGGTGFIYRRDADAVWQIVYKDADGAIKGAEEKPSSTGKLYLIWATDTKVKRKEIPGRSDWNDVEVIDSNLESATWHTMRQIGGAVHIANRSKLALCGYDDSYTNESLNLIPGNIATTIVERDGRAIVGSARASNPNRAVNGAIDTEVPLAQIGNDGELFIANGVDSVPYKRFPGGGRVNPDGVINQVEQVNFFEWEENALSWIDKQEVGNMALFAVYDADDGKGGIYSVGRKDKNHPFVMNLEYQIDADELGALVDVNGTTLVSYQDGSTYGVKAVDPNNKAEATYISLDLYAPQKKQASLTNWTLIEVYMKPLPAGCWVELWYQRNKDGGFQRALTANGDANSFTTANAKQAFFKVGADADIFELKAVLHPYGNETPEIYWLRPHFQ